MVSLEESRVAEAEVRGRERGRRVPCFHCGDLCPSLAFEKEDKSFCCNGCLTVHDLLTSSGLGRFYELDRYPGVSMRSSPKASQWSFLDQSEITQQLVEEAPL